MLAIISMKGAMYVRIPVAIRVLLICECHAVRYLSRNQCPPAWSNQNCNVNWQIICFTWFGDDPLPEEIRKRISRNIFIWKTIETAQYYWLDDTLPHDHLSCNYGAGYTSDSLSSGTVLCSSPCATYGARAGGVGNGVGDLTIRFHVNRCLIQMYLYLSFRYAFSKETIFL